VQTILQQSWTISCFDAHMSEQSDAPRDNSFTSTPVVSLFQFLRKDMDSRSSFLALRDVHARGETERLDSRRIRRKFSLGEACAEVKGIESKADRNLPFALQNLSAKRQITDDRNNSPGVENVYMGLGPEDMSHRSSSLGLEDAHARLETENPKSDAEATKIDVCMSWVAFYLTDAVDRSDRHVTRLMLDVGVGCGLLYTQYRTLATLIEATVGALRFTIHKMDLVLLRTVFSCAGRFISDTDCFVTEMLDHGRLLNKSGLLLRLGLMSSTRYAP
jgi:hypothetical protein